MKYLKITNDIIDLRESFLIDFAYLEIDSTGKVLREIGFDFLNNITHKYPSNIYKYGYFGIFDQNIFDIEYLESDVEKNEFECFWDKI